MGHLKACQILDNYHECNPAHSKDCSRSSSTWGWQISKLLSFVSSIHTDLGGNIRLWKLIVLCKGRWIKPGYCYAFTLEKKLVRNTLHSSVALEKTLDSNTFSTRSLTILTYFGSSVLRNISCMVFLSSALGAIFSNEAELKAILRPLFTGVCKNKEVWSGGSSHSI